MRSKILMLLLILFGFSYTTFSQTINGTVVSDEDNTPLPGVSISVKGTTKGTITDMDGKFSFSIPENSETLVFSFIGYETQEVTINGKTNFDVVLKVDTKTLEEVVVVGYGVQKKSLVTGAIAKVDGDEIAKGGNLRVSQSLQGKTAGVLITNNSGQPGDAVSIRIRGTGTNGDAEPLYIVDGLPLSGAAIDYLNPSDVESIEVLKDAASSSIYGARGANGVVLITTKKGKTNDKFQISYDGYYGVQNPWRKLDMLGKDNYIMMINEAALNAGQEPKFDQAMVDTLGWFTDWQDKMFNYWAPKTSHVVSMTGGTEKATYSSSLAYFAQEGIVAEGQSDYERITYRLNTTRNFGLVTVGSNLNYANITTKGIAANDQYAGASLIQALNTPPIIPVTFSNGEYATPEDFGIAMQEITNPIAMLNYANAETRTNKFIGNVYAEFDFVNISEIFKGLKFRTSYGTELAYVVGSSYTPIYNLDATHQESIDKTSKYIDKYVTWNFENVLTYNTTFGKSNLTAMIGHTAFRNWFENVGGTKNDLIFNDFEHAYIDNATDPESANTWGGFYEHTLLSYFGRVNYDFANKYMLTAVLRMDGSSRFGPENKFGYFPAVSVGWVFSREGFMSSLENILSFGKIRASWGQNGNESIGDFRYTSVMTNGAIYYFGDDQTQYGGTLPSAIANPQLRWETSEQINIGLDLGFLKDRITLNLDYYIKSTKDWLVSAPAPLLLGNVPPVINGGEVKNSGIELELGFKNNFRGVKFDASLTGGFNKNEVVDIQNEEKRLQGGTGGHGQAGILYAEVGTPLGVFYGIQTNGIFQTQEQVDAYVNSEGELIQPNAVPGDFIFVDENGDGKIDDEDRVDLGNPYPDFNGGLNINMSFKGFDFSMFWYAAIGHQIWDATRRYDLNYSNYRTEYLNRWTGEGTTNEYPRVTLNDQNNNWKTPSDFFVKDADYLRLKNISLGYTVPMKYSKYARISKFRVYVAAENLLTFTKYDGFEPEIGGGVFANGIDHGVYPQARTVLVGLNLTF